MKKAISLFFAFALCLSLCACGGSNNVPKTTDSTKDNTAISHPLVQDICCEWYVGSAGSENSPFQSLIINEDGTCVVDGVNATWRVEECYTNDTSLSIYIEIDGQACYGIVYFRNTGAATLTKPSDYPNPPVFQPYEAYKK